MTTQVQIRGAASGTQNARTLVSRELDVDTTNKRLSVHDGSTAGGIKHANYMDVQQSTFNYAAAAGTNALTMTLSPAPSAHTNLGFKFKAASTNTGAVTLNPNSLGAKNLYKKDSNTSTLVALQGGEIIAGGIYDVFYDGTQYQLLSSGSGASGGVDFVASYNLTGLSSQDVALDTSAYTSFRFDLINLSGASTSIVYFRCGSSSTINTGNVYSTLCIEDKMISSAVSTSAVVIPTLTSQISLASGSFTGTPLDGSFTLFAANNSSIGIKALIGNFVQYRSSGDTRSYRTNATVQITPAINIARIYTNSGTFAGGILKVYGIKG